MFDYTDLDLDEWLDSQDEEIAKLKKYIWLELCEIVDMITLPPESVKEEAYKPWKHNQANVKKLHGIRKEFKKLLNHVSDYKLIKRNIESHIEGKIKELDLAMPLFESLTKPQVRINKDYMLNKWIEMLWLKLVGYNIARNKQIKLIWNLYATLEYEDYGDQDKEVQRRTSKRLEQKYRKLIE